MRGVIIDKGKDEGDSKDHVRSRELVDGSGNAQNGRRGDDVAGNVGDSLFTL